eukprot:1194721-Prorocentrum_minimum.AAC.8
MSTGPVDPTLLPDHEGQRNVAGWRSSPPRPHRFPRLPAHAAAPDAPASPRRARDISVTRQQGDHRVCVT